ncbi:hypothetical protein CC2G_007245 [Coprinopsis cinerea AmutBmut pab1-1]|nr:hypothetical protein CC2G_007245 [Coprinopsis cinerea AmutBmut pab1-1]
MILLPTRLHDPRPDSAALQPFALVFARAMSQNPIDGVSENSIWQPKSCSTLRFDRRSGFGMRCLPHPRTLTISACASNGMKQRNVPFTPTIRKIGHVFEEEPGWNLAGGNPTEFSDTPSIGFLRHRSRKD